MAGTISLSLSQQFDALGNPLAGGLLRFIQAGTTATPQNAYQDAALTIVHPNPIVLDSAGRVPQFYLADGQIKILLTDRDGNTQVSADNILVVGPSSGGGGAGVDPTTVFSTGDVKSAYGVSALTGWVRANGRTIGNTTSGATELASTTLAAALFVYLWNTDSSLSVSTGRGASGAADFAASKTIDLPDFRGRVLAGFDSMGNSAASRMTTSMTGVGIGAVSVGIDTRTILTAWLPAYTATGTFTGTGLSGGTLNSGLLVSGTLNSGLLVSGTLNSGTLVGGTLNSGNAATPVRQYTPTAGAGNDTTHLSVGNNAGADAGTFNTPVTGTVSGTVTGTVSGTVTGTVSGTVTGTVTGTPTGTITMNAQGGTSTPFSIVQPTIFVTHYLKL